LRIGMQSCILFVAATVALHLLLLQQVAATTSVTEARLTIDPRDLLLNKAGVQLTVAFTPMTTLPSGGTITMQYNTGFYANGLTPNMVASSLLGFTSTFRPTGTCPNMLNVPEISCIVITTSGASIDSGSAFNITIGGLTVGGTTSIQIGCSLSTSTDPNLIYINSPYSTGTRVTQFSMAIADSDRIFTNAATVTIAFSPSTSIQRGQGGIYLLFPAGFIQNNACSGGSCNYKSSIENAYLSIRGSCNSNLCKLSILNGAQLIPPTGETLPARSHLTITISGVILGSPMGNIPNSVFVSTSSDLVGSAEVDSGYIGLGSYVNGSCPYGMTWSNSVQACTSCTAISIASQSYPNNPLICSDFQDCLSCSACPIGQSVQAPQNIQSFTGNVLFGPPNTWVYYACSSILTSRCPAGSGMQNGVNGGCSPCSFDMYNNGSSISCQYCPSGTYPSYSIKYTTVSVSSGTTPFQGQKVFQNVQGYVMSKSASSCSRKCPVGTGALSDVTVQSLSGSVSSQSAINSLRSGMQNLQGSWGGVLFASTPTLRQGCVPCINWFISKENACQACGTGASDRATLNSMGNTFSFATACVPDICPWPYVAAGQSLMYEYGYLSNQLPTNSPPQYSILPSFVCSTNIHFGGTVAAIAVTIVVLLCAYTVAIYFGIMVEDENDEAVSRTLRRKMVLGMLLITLPPAVDFATDFLYIVQTLFFNYIIFLVTCFFFLLPMFFFWRMLVRHGAHFSFYVGKPPSFAVMEKYDNIPKAFLGLTGYLPLYIINLPILLPLFLLGYAMYMCKVFPMSRVSNPWLRLYTRSTRHASSVVVIIPLLQQSIFEEMIIESIPQLIIQIINNTFTGTWSPLSYISTFVSGCIVFNGIWPLVYYRWYLNMRVGDIPTTPDLTNVVFNFSSIKQGEAPLSKAADESDEQSIQMLSRTSQKLSSVRACASQPLAVQHKCNCYTQFHSGYRKRRFRRRGVAPDPAPRCCECGGNEG